MGQKLFAKIGLMVVSVGSGCVLGAWALNKMKPTQVAFPISVESPQLPPGVPEQGDEAIKIAMKLFNIQLPENVSYPIFDPQLQERGITTGYLLGNSKQVKIGPSAFVSWSILGSTLGHEIEIHGNQSFLKITLADSSNTLRLNAKRVVGQWIPAWKPSARESFEAMGTWHAEREAYMYEVLSARRFGLTPYEQQAIKRVMKEYFPDQNSTNPTPNT